MISKIFFGFWFELPMSRWSCEANQGGPPLQNEGCTRTRATRCRHRSTWVFFQPIFNSTENFCLTKTVGIGNLWFHQSPSHVPLPDSLSIWPCTIYLERYIVYLTSSAFLYQLPLPYMGLGIYWHSMSITEKQEPHLNLQFLECWLHFWTLC